MKLSSNTRTARKTRPIPIHDRDDEAHRRDHPGTPSELELEQKKARNYRGAALLTLNNALAELATVSLEERIADGGEVNTWASIRSTDLERIVARLEAVAVYLLALAGLDVEDDDDDLPF